MKRFLAILSLIIIIGAICTFEEIFLKNFVTDFTAKATNLSNLIKENNQLNENENIESSFETLKENWQKAKITLCFFTNYEKIKSMDESFVKLEYSLKNNDKDLANENISLICNYNQFFDYMMGFNINNLF